MAIIKCKMCGGDMEISPDKTFGTCEYCGSTMTLPKIDDEQRAAAFNRGNHFRRIGEFDKALGVYERIVAEDDTDAEAHWCCALCRFGIEYVEDPASHKRLPTVNRAQYTSILADEDYKSALQYADAAQREVYEAEAHAIDEIQKGILAISQQEEPFDVFICYKETDANGRRTPDSVLATELYHGLTQEGLKVFFARITLEDKLGTAYEPYIFAALNSARVMVVLGTRPEHFNAVWVKNEWSRYLGLIKNGAKKTLIPAYRDMDPYDLPEEFSHLQAQDMAKLGFMQDLIRGVKKILGADEAKPAAPQPAAAPQSGGNVEALLERAYLFLDEGDYDAADEYCEKVLDQDAKNVRAYMGKLLAARRAHKQEDLKYCAQPFDDTAEYKRVLRFADEGLKRELEGYNAFIRERNEQQRLQDQYNAATRALHSARTEAEYKAAAAKFQALADYQDAAALAEQCMEKAENARKDLIYGNAVRKLRDANTERVCMEAMREFGRISGWRDAEVQAEACRKKIEDIKARAEKEKQATLERVRVAEAARKKKKRVTVIVILLAALAIAAFFVVTKVVIPNQKYNEAAALFEVGDYDGAIAAFEALGNYSDSAEQANAAAYAKAEELLATEDYDGAIAAFEALGEYSDSASRAEQAQAARTEAANATMYAAAEGLLAAGDYDRAITLFEALGDYSDSAEQAEQAQTAKTDAANAASYAAAEDLLESGNNVDAAMAFGALGDYSDARARSFALWGKIAKRETLSTNIQHIVGLRSDGTVMAAGDNKYGQCDVSNWADIVAISAGSLHTVGLKSDGTVVAVGSNNHSECDVSDWTDIVSVFASSDHTVGLRSDGTVVACGDNYYGECEVSDWTDIVAMSAGYDHTVGLKSDGTVVAVGDNKYGQCNVSGWTDIVAVAARDYHTVGLRSDGTVVATGNNDQEQCDVSGWTDIVAVSAGTWHTVGLRSDGTVVACGDNDYGECDVSGWTDIVAVAANGCYTVGLRSDGTVVAVGENKSGQCNVSDWTDIVAVAANGRYTVGLRSDGTVVAVGQNNLGQCNVSDWTDIKLPGA